MKKTTLAVLGLLPFAVTAETPPIEILISAGRTAEPGLAIPAGYQIIEREQIENSGARNLPQLLRASAGIQITDGVGGGGSANIDMRGFGNTASSNVAVMIDGRKINPSTDASTLYLNSIDLQNVERIEVIEGSAGTLYGNQAVGGMINVITRKAAGRQVGARVGLGSYDAEAVGANYSERFDNGLSLALNADTSRSDNYRDHNASEFDRFSVRLGMQHGGGETAVSFSYLDDYQETPGALLAEEVDDDRRQVTADFVNDYFDTQSQVVRLDTRQPLNGSWRFEGDLSLRKDRRDFIQSFRGWGPGTSPVTQDRDSVEFNPRLIGTLDKVTLTLGADLLDTDYLLVSAFGPQGTQQRINSAYGQAQYQLNQEISVTGGIRHARARDDIDTGGPSSIELDDQVTVGSLGVVYRPDNALRLYARADQNFRFPKVDEHTNPIFGQPVGLRTQTGVSYETGFDWNTNRYSLKGRLYRLNLEDEISNDAGAFLANVNLDETRRIGGMLSGDVLLNHAIQVGASYEYIDSEITSGTHSGSRVPLVAEHRGTLFAQWQPQHNLLLRADLEYKGDRVLGSDFANTAPLLDAYTVVNLNASYQVQGWHLNARINNLFNELYNESGAAGFSAVGFNPAPERNAMLTASYAFF